MGLQICSLLDRTSFVRQESFCFNNGNSDRLEDRQGRIPGNNCSQFFKKGCAQACSFFFNSIFLAWQIKNLINFMVLF